MAIDVTDPIVKLRLTLHTHKYRLVLDLDTVYFECECGKRLTILEVEKILNR